MDGEDEKTNSIKKLSIIESFCTIHKQFCRLRGQAGCIRGDALELAVVTATDTLNAQITDSGRHLCYRNLVLIVHYPAVIQRPLESNWHVALCGHALNRLRVSRIGHIPAKGEGQNLRRNLENLIVILGRADSGGTVLRRLIKESGLK